MAYKGKCANGKLKTPVRNANGSMRYCKLKKKTSAGRSRDRKKKSGEAHEVRYRKKKRMAKTRKRR